ncbi:MAG: PKD domain-containing protein [Planctomycetota bacterium]|nr:PKD domain-containing protein [Planctomycetota bacterium]
MPRILLTTVCLLSLACATACGSGGGGDGAPPGPTVGRTAVQAGADVLVTDTAGAIQFFGQASDVDGGTVAFAWDTDGDGTADSAIDRPLLGFPAGTRSVVLTVTNAAGDENTARIVVGITDPLAPSTPQAPAVALRVWTLHGTAPAQVVCHATAADPDGGAITSYGFDIDGDGTDDVTGASPTATFTLPASGVFEPAVTVTDDEGATSTASATIVLCDGAPYPDQSPSAQIVVPSGAAQTDTSTPLDLLAFGTDIDGGALASVSWDVDGDGVFGDFTGREVSPTFATEGIHRVRVRLTDDEGNAPAEAALDVLVSDAAPVTGTPSAWAWAEALVVAPSQDVLFHAIGTGGDAPLTYSWDFDGDGTEDSTAPDPRRRFGTPGVYRPRCTVTDADGDVSSADLTLIVEPCGATAAPFFRYACDDLLLLHGGTATLTVTQEVASGSAPATYGLVWKSGPASEDPAADDLVVQDGTLQALPPATTPVAVPPSGDVPIELESLAVDGPARLTCYEIAVRLEDPGVRVQVLTCQVCVLHDAVRLQLLQFGFTDRYRGTLSAEYDTASFAALPGTLPDVFEVELRLDGFTPNLAEIVGLGSAFLSTGWDEEGLTGGHRFFTSTLPVASSAPAKLFTFEYDTTLGAGLGPPVTAGEAILRDAAGRRIGRQALVLP